MDDTIQPERELLLEQSLEPPQEEVLEKTLFYSNYPNYVLDPSKLLYFSVQQRLTPQLFSSIRLCKSNIFENSFPFPKPDPTQNDI